MEKKRKMKAQSRKAIVLSRDEKEAQIPLGRV